MSINNWDKILKLSGVNKSSNDNSLINEQYSKVDSKIENIRKKIEDKLKVISRRKSLGKLDQRTINLEAKLKALQIKLQSHLKNKTTAIMDSQKYMKELENMEKSLMSNNDANLEKSVDSVTTSLKKDEQTPIKQQVKTESLTPEIYSERGTVFVRDNKTEVVLDKIGSFFYIYEIDKGDYLPNQDRTKALPLDESMVIREIAKGRLKPTEELYKIGPTARTNSKLLKASTGMNFKSMTPQQASNFVDKVVNDKIYIKLKGKEDSPILITKREDGQYVFKNQSGKISVTPLSKEDLIDSFVKGILFEKFYIVKNNILLENEKKVTFIFENDDKVYKAFEEINIGSSNTTGAKNITNSIEQLDKLGAVHNDEKYTLGVLQAKLAALGYWQGGRPLSFTKDDYTKSVVKDFLNKNSNKTLKDLVAVDGYSDVSNFKPAGDKPIATDASGVKSYLSGGSASSSGTKKTSDDSGVKSGAAAGALAGIPKKEKGASITTSNVLEGYGKSTYGYEIINALVKAQRKGYNGKYIVDEEDVKILLENIDDNIFYNNLSVGNMDDSDYSELKRNPLWNLLQNDTFIVKYGEGKISTLQRYFMYQVVRNKTAMSMILATGESDEFRFNFDPDFPSKTQTLFINSINAIANNFRQLKNFDDYLKTLSVSILEEKIDSENMKMIDLGLKNFKSR
jgi:hypothetical protein